MKLTTHKFQPKKYYTNFGPYEPALKIRDGDTVVTSTADNAGRDSTDKEVTVGPNPLTGPFYVEGAEPGDSLAIHFDRLWPNRQLGRSSTIVAPHTVDSDYVSELPLKKPHVRAKWMLDLEKGTATLQSPETKLSRLILSLRPMLGCIGVAPEEGQAISSTTSGPYGGNMDYNGFTAGATVYLPVFVPGGLFFVGDGHAVQGDGEIVGTGIEVSFDAQFTVRLLKNKKIGWPRAESAEYIMTIGNARPLEEALQYATTEMLRWLREDYGLVDHTAYILLGQCVEYDVGNVFDPAYTMVCKLQKNLLKK